MESGGRTSTPSSAIDAGFGLDVAESRDVGSDVGEPNTKPKEVGGGAKGRPGAGFEGEGEDIVLLQGDGEPESENDERGM